MSQKVCIICGVDVGDRPRVKDASGRYACKACLKAHERAGGGGRAAEPAPVVAAGGTERLGNADLLGPGFADTPDAEARESDAFDLNDALAAAAHAESLPDAAPGGGFREMNACPACERPVHEGQAVCVNCGADLAAPGGGRAKARKTRVLKEDKERAERAGSRVPSVAVSPAAAAWIGGGVFAALGVLGVVVEPTFLLVYAVLWAAFGLATWIWSIVAAFQDREVGWGITLIVAPFFCIGGLLNLWYVFKESGRENLKACYAVAFIAGIGGFVYDTMTTAERLGDPRGRANRMALQPLYAAHGPAHPEAERLAKQYGEPEPIDVEWALITLADEVMRRRIEARPDHPERADYTYLMNDGQHLADYPVDVVREAVEWFERLDRAERRDLLDVGELPDG